MADKNMTDSSGSVLLELGQSCVLGQLIGDRRFRLRRRKVLAIPLTSPPLSFGDDVNASSCLFKVVQEVIGKVRNLLRIAKEGFDIIGVQYVRRCTFVDILNNHHIMTKCMFGIDKLFDDMLPLLEAALLRRRRLPRLKPGLIRGRSKRCSRRVRRQRRFIGLDAAEKRIFTAVRAMSRSSGAGLTMAWWVKRDFPSRRIILDWS